MKMFSHPMVAIEILIPVSFVVPVKIVQDHNLIPTSHINLLIHVLYTKRLEQA